MLIEFLSQVNLVNHQNQYYLFSEFNDIDNNQKYKLSFLSMNNSLKGVIDFNECEIIESESSYDPKDVLKLGSKLIVDNDDPDNNYCYQFSISDEQQNSGKYSLQLLLRVPSLDLSRQILTFDVQKVDSMALMLELMPKLLVFIQTKDKIINELKSENSSLREISNKAVESLDNFTVQKEENDSILFSKFVAILNEKKNKIRELEEQVTRNGN